MVKLECNSVEIHPQLSRNGHPMDDTLVAFLARDKYSSILIVQSKLKIKNQFFLCEGNALR
jgi:hypothetical protein